MTVLIVCGSVFEVRIQRWYSQNFYIVYETEIELPASCHAHNHALLTKVLVYVDALLVYREGVVGVFNLFWPGKP